MSADEAIILEITPRGAGWALDLGGKQGSLQPSVKRLGYHYVNLDIQCHGNTEVPSVIGDAHALPFQGGSLQLVISKDTLEHFRQPWTAVKEVHRVLKPGGLFVIWVPFMHPFHGTDYYRYSPLGLRSLLSEFEIVLFESPLWVFTIIGLAVREALKRLHLRFLERPVKQVSQWLDRRFMHGLKRPASFAAGYRVVARKPVSM